MRLENKVALVTGAGSGMGQASAVLFAKEGAAVTVVDINDETGQETVDMINKDGGKSFFLKADVYENLLKTEIFPGIASENVSGYRGIQLFRRPLDGEVEFMTIMWFDSWDAVKQFAGEDYETAVVPPKAREVLSRFDDRSQHYEIKEQITY